MRKAERGTRNRACGRRAVGPGSRTEPDPVVARSAFRVPRSLLGVALLALVSIACRGDGRTPLVIYSPHGRDLLTLLERRFEQLHPDADVCFGGPATIFARGAHDSLLEPFRPSWAETIEPHGRGPGDLYFAAYETPAVIVYAEQAVKPDEAPRDWDDLLDRQWKGKVLIRDPLAS